MNQLDTDFNILKATRKNLTNLINAYDIDQLNFIPEGFKNNLFWNFCHVIVTQQLLVYNLSGTEMVVSKEEAELFRKGSRPEATYHQDLLERFKGLASSTITRCEQDLANDAFGNYKEYTTSYGFTLRSVEEAIRFNNIHEAMHLGTCLAIKKHI